MPAHYWIARSRGNANGGSVRRAARIVSSRCSRSNLKLNFSTLRRVRVYSVTSVVLFLSTK